MKCWFPVVLLSILSFGSVRAQNWALINPLYKYNYSIGGGDTIVHQIRVDATEMITPDSFRYDLNKIATRCNSCGAGCDLQVHLPQFLQHECHSGPDSWRFTDPGDLIIHPRAMLNESWTFNTQNGAEGIVSEITEGSIFGSMDSVRTMTTSLNDTVRWTKTFGILHWHMHDEPMYHLIGVHGPDDGTLIPSLAQFFPFQPGDVVELGSGWSSNLQNGNEISRVYIEERSDEPTRITFSGYAFNRISYDGGVYVDYSNGPFTWVVDSLNIPAFRLLQSAPQELVHLGNGYSSAWPTSIDVVARHHRNVDGNYVIEADKRVQIALFQAVNDQQSGCLPMLSPGACETDVRFNDQLGLNSWSVCFGNNGDGEAMWTIAAIIAGDTVGTWLNDEYFQVGMKDEFQGRISLHPNPANDHLVIQAYGSTPTAFRIADLTGHFMKWGPLPASVDQVIDVSSLAEGIYVLNLSAAEGSSSQRFIIAQ